MIGVFGTFSDNGSVNLSHITGYGLYIMVFLPVPKNSDSRVSKPMKEMKPMRWIRYLQRSIFWLVQLID